MEKQRINQKILCKRMDELEMAINELNPLEASEINKRLLKIENMLPVGGINYLIRCFKISCTYS